MPIRRRKPSTLRRLADILLAYALVGALIAAALRLAPLSRAPEDGAAIEGRAYVIDGDTLAIRGQRIRLVGMDAPEMEQLCEAAGRAVRCGLEAREALRRMIGEAPVRCATRGRDIYRRILAACRSGAGDDLAAGMVAAGLALADGCCLAEQAQARAAGRGLWAGRFEAPWDWRREHRTGEDGRP